MLGNGERQERLKECGGKIKTPDNTKFTQAKDKALTAPRHDCVVWLQIPAIQMVRSCPSSCHPVKMSVGVSANSKELEPRPSPVAGRGVCRGLEASLRGSEAW